MSILSKLMDTMRLQKMLITYILSNPYLAPNIPVPTLIMVEPSSTAT